MSLQGDRELETLCAAVPKPGQTGDDEYEGDVLFVVLSDGRRWPTNVKRCLRVARELGLKVERS